jgi:hypothetical protein
MKIVLFVLLRKLRFRSPPRAGRSGAFRSDLPEAVASFLRHGASWASQPVMHRAPRTRPCRGTRHALLPRAMPGDPDDSSGLLVPYLLGALTRAKLFALYPPHSPPARTLRLHMIRGRSRPSI